MSTIPDSVTTAIEDALDATHSAGYDLGRSDQRADDATAYAELEQEFADYRATHPDDVPPPPATVFSAYAGPATKGGAGQNAATRARVAKAFGVDLLPADRVYSGTSFGVAAQCPSPLVAVSYKLVPALAKGDATVARNLTAEIKALAARTGQRFDVALDHEVDSKIRGGTYTVDQYVKAGPVFADIVGSIGADTIRQAVCYTGYVFTLPTSNPSHPDNYYDGDLYDLIALDPYWPAQPSADAAFGPSWEWSSAKGKPVVVWETGYQLGGNPQSPTEAELASKVAAVRDWWSGRGEYVLWFEAVHEVSNLLEGHPAALAVWSSAVQASV